MLARKCLWGTPEGAVLCVRWDGALALAWSAPEECDRTVAVLGSLLPFTSLPPSISAFLPHVY